MDELKKAYLLLQENCGIKVGDTVKVLRKAKDHESGWGDEWTCSMDKAVGKESAVTHVTNSGIGLNITGHNYPFFVLEKLTTDWTDKLCDDVPALCRVWDCDEEYQSFDLINGASSERGQYRFSGKICNWTNAELVPKDLLQAMLERYYD